MAHNYEYKFELRPQKFIFVPNLQTKTNGKKIIKELTAIWHPADYFYHIGKRGGHVAAMRPHVGNQFKASLDLTNFFTSVSRTKVIRSLKKAGVSSSRSFDIAFDSCVEFRGRKFVPYGFPQSMLLATLAIEKSALGAMIQRQKANGIFITMYVDDILLSHSDKATLTDAYEALISSANQASFTISDGKSSSPDQDVEAFNCHIEKGLSIRAERMKQFAYQIVDGNSNTKKAILRYVDVVNSQQANDLDKIT